MSGCPSAEDLLLSHAERTGEHARGCVACQSLLAEHEALERALFQLTDPAPPADLVSRVMASVRAAPVPAPVNVRLALGIVAVALAAGVALLLASDAALGQMGGTLARLLLGARSFAGGLWTGVRALREGAALPVLVAMMLAFLASLAAVQRLVARPLPSSDT